MCFWRVFVGLGALGQSLRKHAVSLQHWLGIRACGGIAYARVDVSTCVIADRRGVRIAWCKYPGKAHHEHNPCLPQLIVTRAESMVPKSKDSLPRGSRMDSLAGARARLSNFEDVCLVECVYRQCVSMMQNCFPGLSEMNRKLAPSKWWLCICTHASRMDCAWTVLEFGPSGSLISHLRQYHV